MSTQRGPIEILIAIPALTDDHGAVVFPHRTHSLPVVDCGLTALRVWLPRYPCLRMERAEADQEYSDQECSSWRCEYCVLAGW